MNDNRTEYFTVVFRGDVRKLGFNPMTAQTVYGDAVWVSVGDCLTRTVGTAGRPTNGKGQGEVH